jgi:hypothetical protein
MKLDWNKDKQPPTSKKELITDKTVKFWAHSIYQSLKEEGCESKDIIGVSSQLIGLVTSALDERNIKKQN